jgi:hypothetical protein
LKETGTERFVKRLKWVVRGCGFRIQGFLFFEGRATSILMERGVSAVVVGDCLLLDIEGGRTKSKYR